jgi:peptidyl-prolyl cis-trans isomerase D
MLQAIRNKSSGWIALSIIVLVLFTMLFFGIGDYMTTAGDTYVAKVGDEEISQNRFRERYEQWRQNMRQQMGDAYDAQMFEQPAFKRQMLDRMVDEAVLRQANERMGLVVPASRLRSEIMNAPAFQVAGQFDEQAYRNFLTARRMSAQGLEQELRDSFAVQLLPEAVQTSAIVTDADVDRHLRLSEQTRDFRFVRVTEPAEPVSEEVSEEALQAYYDENQAQFMKPESVTVEYVEMDAGSITGIEPPAEGDLEERYENEKNRFGTAEQRLVSHILVRASGDDADAQRSALAKAEDIAARAKADDADFAAIARERSEDIGTREEGGDLGWIERGLTDPAFEEAAFAMEAGSVSDPVRSDEGYHVIHVREIRPEAIRPFEEVRAELVAEHEETERARLFAERSGELTDLIYRDPGALQPTAEAMSLEIKTAGPFTREAGEGVFADPRVRQAVFSDTVLAEGNVSDPIEVGENHIIAVRVAEHTPAEPRPLVEVAAQIRTSIVAERRREALQARADALFARVEAGEPLETIAAELGVEVETADGVVRSAATPERALITEAFAMPRPSDGAPLRKRVDLGAGHAIVELTSVTDGDPAAVPQARREQVREELQQSYAGAEMQGLLASLRGSSEVDIAEDRLQ